MVEKEEQDIEIKMWLCFKHHHWWYPVEQLQAPEGYCYCCEKKKEMCKCKIEGFIDNPDYIGNNK